MQRQRNPNEIRAKVYSMDPELLESFKQTIAANYRKSSGSRILGPDQDGSFWCFINIYRETS